MNIKYKISAILLIAVFLLPGFSSAQSLTIAQLQAQIQELLALVRQLQQQLVQLQGGATPWCHTFNRDLKIGSGGSEVTALQTALQKVGFKTDIDGTFDEQTASAVTGFQEKYRDDILTPNGLQYGTGYVGKSTRAKLNLIYGCASPVPTPIIVMPILPPSPVISTSTPATSAPTSTPIVSSPATINYFYALPSIVDSGRTTSLNFSASGSGLSQLRLLVGCPPGVTSSLGQCSTPPTFAPDTNGYGLGILNNVTGISQQIVATLAGYDSSGNIIVSRSVTITVLPGTTTPTPTSTQQSITVLSPNGGETWQLGSTQTLRWNAIAAPQAANLKVGISLMNSQGYAVAILQSPTNEPLWTVAGSNSGVVVVAPSSNISVPPGQYKIRISFLCSIGATDPACSTYDDSDTPFSIVAATSTPTQPSFTSSKTTVNSGDSVTFSWNVPVAPANLTTSFTIGCVSGIAMYDSQNQGFWCGDIDRPISQTGSYTVLFTNTNSVATQVTAQLDYGGSMPLTTTVTVNPPTNYAASGRDSRRIADLRQVQNALELYFNKCGFYPGAVASPSCPVAPPAAPLTWTALTAALTGSLIGVSTVPNDPLPTQSYYYGINSSGASYTLAATLEDRNNVVFQNYSTLSITGYSGYLPPSCASPVYCIRL